jgi:hypothetical protein
MGELLFFYIVITLYFILELDSILHLRKPGHKCLHRDDKDYYEKYIGKKKLDTD